MALLKPVVLVVGILASAATFSVEPFHAVTACECFREGFDKNVDRTSSGAAWASKECQQEHGKAYYWGSK